MGKVYLIISGKGGVGKTTSAVNIGCYMNSIGEDVVIVDANLTTPNVGLHLGSPIVPITLNHVMNGKARVDDAIYQHESGTKILPSSLSLGELKNITMEKLSDVTKKLRKKADHIILDSSAGLGEEARASIKACDEVIVVANPDICSITDALKTIKLAEQMKKYVRGAIITRSRADKADMSLDSIKEMLDVPILGIIPEDDSVRQSLAMKNPVVITHPKSDAAGAYARITRKILGTEYMKNFGEEGWFSRLLGRFGL